MQAETYYIADGTMGECGHRHRTPEAAQECIDKVQRSFDAMPAGAGQHYYCGRDVYEIDATGRRILYSEDEWYG